jgi:DNA-binding protein HU-beta
LPEKKRITLKTGLDKRPVKRYAKAGSENLNNENGYRGRPVAPAERRRPVAVFAVVEPAADGANVRQEERKMAFKKAKGTDKPMTKAKTIEALATETGLTKKDVSEVLGAMADLAYAQAPAGFTIPGIGKLVVVQRKARMGRNPATGESIKIPAKKVLKFRIAKAAKDAIVPPKK